MTNEKELLDRLYQAEVATDNLKDDFELRFLETKTDYRTRYKGKELKVNLNLLGVIRKERLGVIDRARMNVQTEIIGDNVKRSIQK